MNLKFYRVLLGAVLAYSTLHGCRTDTVDTSPRMGGYRPPLDDERVQWIDLSSDQDAKGSLRMDLWSSGTRPDYQRRGDNLDYDPNRSFWSALITEFGWQGSDELVPLDSTLSMRERINPERRLDPSYDRIDSDVDAERAFAESERKRLDNERSRHNAMELNLQLDSQLNAIALSRVHFEQFYSTSFLASGANAAIEQQLRTLAKNSWSQHDIDVDRALATLSQPEIVDVTPEFQTAPTSREGQLVRRAHGRMLQTSSSLRAAGASRAQIHAYETVSPQIINAMDRSYASGRILIAEEYRDLFNTLTDVALGLIPGVSFSKDVFEAWTGKSLVTGTELGTFDRSIAVFGIITFGIGSKLKHFRNILAFKDAGAQGFIKGYTPELAKTVDNLHGVVDSAIHAIGPKKFSDIISTPSGSRPDPRSYLPKEYINAHLAKFEEGASKFMRKADLNRYGPAQADGTSFVLSKFEADSLLSSTAGNRRALEDALGFPAGYLDNVEMVRVDIPVPKNLNLRVPSGNEAGANSLWLPGGKLPNGNSEAVIDLGSAPQGSWTTSPLN